VCAVAPAHLATYCGPIRWQINRDWQQRYNLVLQARRFWEWQFMGHARNAGHFGKDIVRACMALDSQLWPFMLWLSHCALASLLPRACRGETLCNTCDE
jgi:hypothetical protein